MLARAGNKQTGKKETNQIVQTNIELENQPICGENVILNFRKNNSMTQTGKDSCQVITIMIYQLLHDNSEDHNV